MFFTLIIPAFNADQIEKLLYSIICQDEEDLEVIICDDSDYNLIYNIYEIYQNNIPNINIRYFKTEKHKYKCPGNTRYDAMKHISKDAKYILFADDDDFLEPNQLHKIKEFIIQNNYPEMVFSKIYEVHDTNCKDINNIYENGQYPKNKILDSFVWLHGNLYRYDFIFKNGINFKENLRSHEDAYFNCSVLAALHGNNIEYCVYDDIFYNWVRRDKSLSNIPIDNHMYIEKYLHEYIYSSTEPMFNAVKIYKDNDLYFRGQCMGTLVFSYFYYQSFIWSEGLNIIQENLEYIRELLYKIMETFSVTKNDIINLVYSCPESYNDMKVNTLNMGYRFVETTSFRDFILKL